MFTSLINVFIQAINAASAQYISLTVPVVQLQAQSVSSYFRLKLNWVLTEYVYAYSITEILLQWNLVIKRSDITKPSYNKVILLGPALYISLFYPDIMRNLI